MIKLVGFLRQKYKKSLEKEEKLKSTDYYPCTNKKVELGAEYTLFVIHFFDGLYISSPCKSIMGKLKSFMDEYNNQSSGVVSVQKEIEKNEVYIPHTDELRKFSVIYTRLGRSTVKYLIEKEDDIVRIIREM